MYAANLVLAGAAASFRIYSWDNDSSNAVPQLAFLGDPGAESNLRWGDSMAVRGGGTNTEILLSPGTGPTVSLIKMSEDGINLNQSPFVITVNEAGSNVVSTFAQLGLAFGAGNTFFGKNSSFLLREVTYDLLALTGEVTHSYPFNVANTVPSPVTAIAVDTNKNFLAGLAIENPDNVQLYSIADLNLGPVLRDQELFTVKNVNGNLTGAAAFGGDRLFVLDSNNGLKAFQINPNFVPPALPITITSIVLLGNSVVLTFTTESGRTYQVQSKDSLSDIIWINQGVPIVAMDTMVSSTNSISSTNRFYRVQTP